MIYITGDTHGDFSRFEQSVFPEQKHMTKDDHVIICGDFGGVWAHTPGQSKEFRAEAHKLDTLDQRTFTTLFVPGNHENYDRLMSDEFPTISRYGGLMKEIRPSVCMMMRGEMYTIEGKKIFAFGGASSHDIEDGILDGTDPKWKQKARCLSQAGRNMYRVSHLSWWKEELPSEEELQHGCDTLKAHNHTCDFIITHEGPASDVVLLHRGYHPDTFSLWLEEEVRWKTDYKHWFFGHYHEEKNINVNDHVLYEQITRIV